MTVTDELFERFKFAIQKGYEYKLFIDDLPSATVVPGKNGNKNEVDYFEGIPIGEYEERTDSLYIFNHLNLTVFTHSTYEKHERIVGFEVLPMSITNID